MDSGSVKPLYTPSITMIEKIVDEEMIKRAGVIPYIKRQNNVFFLFGLDEGIASISDFGGTREKKDKDIIDTALREFREETFGIIGTLDRSHLLHSHHVVGKTGYHQGEKGILFFVKYRSDFPFYVKMKEFKERNVPGDETRGLIVLSREQLVLALNKPEERLKSSKIFHFHPKVRNVLLSGKDIIGSL